MPQALKVIFRITLAVGALLMLAGYAMRLVNNARDSVEATLWIDKHPGIVLGFLGITALLLLAPKWLWDRILPNPQPRLCMRIPDFPVHSRANTDNFPHTVVERFLTVEVGNEHKKKSISNVRVQLQSIEPSFGILFPAIIGMPIAGDGDSQINLAPTQRIVIALFSIDMLNPSKFVLICAHTGNTNFISANVPVKLKLGVLGDNAQPDVREYDLVYDEEKGPLFTESS